MQVSAAFWQLGNCAGARDAADKALAIATFGMAQWNKRQAEFCLEMQTIGLITPQQAP